MSKIVGRQKEQKMLNRIWRSRTAELVAVYGRRRVGKTFLVREFFSSLGRYFELAGKKDTPMREQLKNFSDEFARVFYPGISLSPPTSWRDALLLLTRELEKTPSQKVVLFFDELPWLASRKSGFISALDYFWNGFWSRMPHVKVVLCGSAASWMLEHLIQAKGGLHNRITGMIQLQPFSLRETREYLISKKIRLSEMQILDLYMGMGGIPYYLNYVERGKSAEQNIQDICFSSNGILQAEFERLFRSLFDRAEENLRLVRAISSSRDGISREELIRKVGMSSGGTFNKRIQELVAAGFIQGFVSYGYKKKEQHFRILDEYSAFYLTWIKPIADKGFAQINYWKACGGSARWAAWAGGAFESVCFKHLAQIIHALELDSMPCEIGNWRFIHKKGAKERGAQVDLLLDRADDAVTLCEIKYSVGSYVIDKVYARDLHHKIDVFREKTKTDKQLFLALITTKGLKKGLWSDDLVTNEVTLKDLFAF